MPNLPIDPKEENILFSDLIYIERKIIKKLRLSQNAMGYDEAAAALADLEKREKIFCTSLLKFLNRLQLDKCGPFQKIHVT